MKDEVSLMMRWTPCAERLPIISNRYLVTNTAIGSWIVDINIYDIERGGWVKPGKPIAWMPLPEGYGENESG